MTNLIKPSEIIERYITIKRGEKDFASQAKDLKETFLDACDKVAEEKNQIEVSGVLLYTIERKKYEYSKAIVALEKELKTAKEKFEENNVPMEVTRCWAVKF